MNQAHGAETHSPAVACKPAEIIGSRPGATASFNLPETPNFKNDSMRIGKSVPMRSLHHNAIGWFGDRLMALAAKYIFLFFRRSLLGLLFNSYRAAFFSLLVRGDAEKKGAI